MPILVVEGHDATARILESLLKRLGFGDVDEASDGLIPHQRRTASRNRPRYRGGLILGLQPVAVCMSPYRGTPEVTGEGPKRRD
jgi:hypothetical protein